MKPLLIVIMLAAIMLASCSIEESRTQTGDKREETAQTVQPQVEVIYFHGKQRCITCKAIEKVASEAVTNNYSQQIADGKIRFIVVDIDSPQGEPVADKYHVARSSLLVVNHKADGSETVKDMTDKAFAYARKKPEAFRTMLCEVINHLLK